VNVLSDDAVAVANAEQDATIDQSTGGEEPLRGGERL
jgi:hypothetical protein